MIVIDASIFLASVLEDEESSYADSVIDDIGSCALEAIAPSLFQLEVFNIILMAKRRKRINVTYYKKYLKVLEYFPVDLVQDIEFENIIHLADQHQLTAYDATYLALAEQFNFPIATLDKSLKRAAKKMDLLYT